MTRKRVLWLGSHKFGWSTSGVGIRKPFIWAELAMTVETHGGRSYQSCKREDSENGALQCVLNSDPCDLREEQIGGYVEAEAYK